MTKFLVVYVAGLTAEQKAHSSVNAAVEAVGMKAWGEWASANSSRIVDHGAPLGGTLSVGPRGVVKTRNHLTGYVIVEAPTAEEAAGMFLGHPHFSVFAGSHVEVIECLDMPTAH